MSKKTGGWKVRHYDAWQTNDAVVGLLEETHMRKLGPFGMREVGLGCMGLSHAYGEPLSLSAGREVLAQALDIGFDHFDSAALYGFGLNEELLGPFLKPHRDKVVLASKCGMRGVDGTRTIDGRPEALRNDLEQSLRRLQTDVIDLYYLHRYDKAVPIEESVGQMSRFVEEGKVRAIGLSEVSAATIRKAHAVHPLAAVQSEYSLWSRDVEIAALDTCLELAIGFVAFSPLGRGFLTGVDLDPAQFTDTDIRRSLPRFNEPAFAHNRRLLPAFRSLATEAGVAPAQLALYWVLQQGPHVHVILGSTSPKHLATGFEVMNLNIDKQVLKRGGELINQNTVSGGRYPPAIQAEVDTEEFV